MTSEDIIRMAREAGFDSAHLTRFAELVFEQGRQEGMKQERALWTLTKLSQEIEAQPEQKPVAWEQFHEYLVERNFCPRCGKRLASGFVEISIHTCTPPKDAR